MSDGIALVGFLIVILMGLEINQLRSEVNLMNSKLNKISKCVGVCDELKEEIIEELKELVSRGEKIKAIKKYRMVTGAGLKEAKDYVDSLS
ncbi:MAG: ribosomal protein L7/L12 [Clostridium sp.]|jgi:ribosomal protein L7/L12|uniref:ribosomal protein L7/L12 n=1 Tax=Clostridium sp. TaxID=1506 RepID=UPI0025C552F7|nr:ribosomal protein L7/L12 [Clostridium sp.]MCH3963258.1 ribosomal protein L7/L12 [Clostridium sp.]MCI1717230.1 ribosomal protein L7/L12 [Clostridium sp.]MCI1801570.1 ribosomal protein L7/L12 [Clostridium sp.]MCI1815416.1 ribosomal protein L7/L12 [Clostridium sp.]MCI1872319.1 ribosomal protein L7/L12 [Clostridium sp.]